MKQLVNFRDIGGLYTIDGKRVKKRKLLRAGEVVGISKEDAKSLVNDFDLHLIIDFRDNEEIEERPDDVISDVEYCHINVMENLTEIAASRENLMKNFSVERADERMKGIYKSIIKDPTAQKAYREFITVLLNQTEGAALFHCFAGKDRTGIGAAIILTILGVKKEDILEDYLKTNELRKEANYLIIENGEREGFNREQLDGLNSLMSVKSSYLQEIYDITEVNYGSFMNYIKNVIGIKDDEIQQLKSMYLENLEN